MVRTTYVSRHGLPLRQWESLPAPNVSAMPRSGIETPPPEAMQSLPYIRRNASLRFHDPSLIEDQDAEDCQDLRGAYIDNTGSVIVIEQNGNVVSCKNLSHASATIPVYGTISFHVLSMFGLTAQIKDGSLIWSDGTVWTRSTKPMPPSPSAVVDFSQMLDDVTSNGSRTTIGVGADPLLPGVVGIPGVWVKISVSVEEMRARLPMSYTCFCLLLFIMPLVLLFKIDSDVNFEYWILNDYHSSGGVSEGFSLPLNDFQCYLLLVPFVFIIVHIIHYFLGGPSRILMALTYIVVSAVLLTMSNAMVNDANALWRMLDSSDCDTFVRKQELGVQWENAFHFYLECVHREAKINNVSSEEIMAVTRIEDCLNYANEVADHPSWPYLAVVEGNMQCGGWCYESDALWTYKTTKDSCTKAVALDLRVKGQYILFQVAFYCVCLLLFAVVALVSMGPVFQPDRVCT